MQAKCPMCGSILAGFDWAAYHCYGVCICCFCRPYIQSVWFVPDDEGVCHPCWCGFCAG